MIHIPVLVEEVLEQLNIQPGKTYIDATLDGGGHAREMLKRLGPKGKVLGIERDEKLALYIKKQNIKNLIIEAENYIHMAQLAQKHNIGEVHGVLFDFGLSSWHLEESGRGFSFNRDEVLDMRFSRKETITAASIINSYSADDLSHIFSSFGEVRGAHSFARAIVTERKKKRIITTGQLADIAKKYIHGGKAHPATRIFQALRIAVNQELDAMRLGLEAAMKLVAPGGRVVAISFHSLEDRIVKNAFRAAGHILTKKPIIASRAELSVNPRARSAKLRAWENV
jgi:16S rRNA (cytosine1402-N4)-methyltransferase